MPSVNEIVAEKIIKQLESGLATIPGPSLETTESGASDIAGTSSFPVSIRLRLMQDCQVRFRRTSECLRSPAARTRRALRKAILHRKNSLSIRPGTAIGSESVLCWLDSCNPASLDK